MNITTDEDLGTIYSVAVPVKRVKPTARLGLEADGEVEVGFKHTLSPLYQQSAVAPAVNTICGVLQCFMLGLVLMNGNVCCRV